MTVKRIGIDLAKSVFQVHGVDGRERTVIRKRLKRSELLSFFAQLPVCVVGIEACGSTHHWARQLHALGHEVRLMAPRFVAAYRKSDKNDGNDAEAVCEAVGRPNMRFVPIKSEEQQAVLSVHRARELLVGQRPALINQIRGLLSEYGWSWARARGDCVRLCRRSSRRPRTPYPSWRGSSSPICTRGWRSSISA